MIFTDSNYWIALFSEKDENHERACELANKIAAQNSMLTDHALGEVFTVICKKNGKQNAYEACQTILATPRVDIVQPTEEDLLRTLEKGRQYGLSFCDCLNVVLMESQGVKEIVSFDSDFDKFARIQRIF